jgi:hypothetical protein
MQTFIQYRCTILFILIFTLTGFSQTSPTDTSKFTLYRTSPVWKDMIDDTTANFFVVQKAFELFWNGRELPEEEDEVIGEKGRLKNTFINRIFNSKELKEQQLRESLSFDYKRYRHWLIKTEPYVKDDGSIMTPTERLELWKNQSSESKGAN